MEHQKGTDAMTTDALNEEAVPFPGLESRLRNEFNCIPTEQQSLHSIAISLKRIADRIDGNESLAPAFDYLCNVLMRKD